MRVSRFFLDDNGRESMTRLLMFLAFWPATFVVCSDPGEDTLSWFLGAYVLGYVGGKANDAFGKNSSVVRSESESVTVVSSGGDSAGDVPLDAARNQGSVSRRANRKSVHRKAKA